MNVLASLGCFIACGGGSALADDAPTLAAWLNVAGIKPVVTYEGDAAANLSGGLTRGATFTSNLHVQVGFDLDRLAGVPGVSAYFDGLWIDGGQPSRFVGDAQGISNIAGPASVRLYEAWLQYNFPGQSFSILAGRYDLNTEFYRLSSADLFINSSFGIGAAFGLSGFAGPSVFPDTSVGVRFGYKPETNTVLRFAVLDGAPLDRQDGSPNPFDARDGLLLVAEAAWLTRPAADNEPVDHRFRIGRRATPLPYDDKIAIGAWYYTARFDDLAPASSDGRPELHNGEAGAYVVLDRLLWQSTNDAKRRVTGFLQVGTGQPIVDRFGVYLGAGLAAAGLFPGRPDDEMGLGMAMARNGSSYVAGQRLAGLQVDAAETAVELTWLAPVTAWFALQPDVQYVVHPNTDVRRHDAVVGQLRFELTF